MADEYILLLADIHANTAALDAVLVDAQRRYHSAWPLPIWFLGDLFGRGPAPGQVWEQLMDDHTPEAVVAGNHDWGMIGRHKNIRIGQTWHGLFNPEDWEVLCDHRRRLRDFGLLRLDHTHEPAAGTSFGAVQGWPVVASPRPGMYLVHGGMDTPLDVTCGIHELLDYLVWGYVRAPLFADYTLEALRWLVQQSPHLPEVHVPHGSPTPPQVVMVGHYHRRVFYWRGAGGPGWDDAVRLHVPYMVHPSPEFPLLISPGGVGFPRERDRYDHNASYAVIQMQQQMVRSVTFHSTAYDYQAVCTQMERQGYPHKLIRLLQPPDTSGLHHAGVEQEDGC